MFTGRIWKFGDDINTDLIQPGSARNLPLDQRHLACFSANRPGWSSEVHPGDIVIAGKNFGTGSSRPAAQNFLKLGIAFIGAETVNGLFLRNSINFGLPVMAVPGVSSGFEEPDIAEVDLSAGTLHNTRTQQTFHFAPLPPMLLDLLARGGLMKIMYANHTIRPLAPSGSEPATR
ncbi:MAG: 3-isopropylmalate dehydratase [Chloroflexi bacterium]|nr:3-isopropylmalate dehydratase [Chloroflexota bacterium]